MPFSSMLGLRFYHRLEDFLADCFYPESNEVTVGIPIGIGFRSLDEIRHELAGPGIPETFKGRLFLTGKLIGMKMSRVTSFSFSVMG